MSHSAALALWLQTLEARHPQHHIELGLSRVRAVFDRMAITPPAVITVTGTNGKGSTSSMIAAILKAAAYSVGLYMSPHLLRYNERVKIAGAEVSDADLCDAFSAVEEARISPTPVDLTYFEFGTLVAFWLFHRAHLDCWVLEVGLGGRFDAVNVIDADVSVVTAIDIDHADYLGATRDAVGFEKGHIARERRPLICGDKNPPQGFLDTAEKIGASLVCLGRDFDITVESEDALTWCLTEHAKEVGKTVKHRVFSRPALLGAHQFSNAAAAVMAVLALPRLPVAEESINAGLSGVKLAGRLETVSLSPHIVCDVAHNPHAARALAAYLSRVFSGSEKRQAVLAMLADKDIESVIAATKNVFHEWHIAPLPPPRGAGVARILEALEKNGVPESAIFSYASVEAACRAVLGNQGVATHETAKIAVFGSFLTVAAALTVFQSEGIYGKKGR